MAEAMLSAMDGKHSETAFEIRLADDADDALSRLASLAESRAPSGPVMLAELDGEPVAAVALADGHAVADPRRAHAGVLAALRLRRLEARLLFALVGG
jgi:hypothetical protein